MPSIEHEAVVGMLSEGLGLEALPVLEQRAAMEAFAGLSTPEPGVAASATRIGAVPADWVVADNDEAEQTIEPERVVLYLHGGAYTMGSRNTHRGLAGRIARAAGARVLLPEYRLAPEHPFPAALEDALQCWHALLAQGLSANRMAIAGDSAGGGLALATLLALKAEEAPLPACAVLLSPWTDLEGTGPSAEPNAVDDPMLSLAGLRESAAQYAGTDLRNPLAAPLHGDLTALPPLLIQVGTREILLSDSTRVAERAVRAGVDVTLEVEEGLIHVWQMLPELPEARVSIQRIGRFIRQHC